MKRAIQALVTALIVTGVLTDFVFPLTVPRYAESLTGMGVILTVACTITDFRNERDRQHDLSRASKWAIVSAMVVTAIAMLAPPLVGIRLGIPLRTTSLVYEQEPYRIVTV